MKEAWPPPGTRLKGGCLVQGFDAKIVPLQDAFREKSSKGIVDVLAWHHGQISLER